MAHIRNWLLKTSQEELLSSQDAVLKQFIDRPLAYSQVQLPSGYTINYIDSKLGNEPSKPGEKTLVLAHGLGSGLGFFFMNIENLLKDAGKGGQYDRVIAFDWLGFGGSSRPECRAPRYKWWSSITGFSICKSKYDEYFENEIHKELNDPAAAFFVDSFEEWREQLGVDKFTLVGHSLGGYLSARYTMRHPSRIEGLVLASPVGLPIAPSKDTTHESNLNGFSMPWQYRLIDAAWSGNFTPGQVFRAWSYFSQNGAANVERIIKARFNDRWNGDETNKIANYLYHLTAQPGSGEYAMNSLLVPIFTAAAGQPVRRGMYARVPFTPYLHLFPKEVPILVLFGDNDWLAPRPEDAQHFVGAAKKEGLNVELKTTPLAGHHLYLDNYKHFNQGINALHKK